MITVNGRSEGTLVPVLPRPVFPAIVTMRGTDGGPAPDTVFLIDGSVARADATGNLIVRRCDVEPLLNAGLKALLNGTLYPP